MGEDGAGLGGDGAGGGFEDQVVGDGGGLVLDDQGGGQGVDVLVEGDLGLSAGGGEPAQGRVDVRAWAGAAAWVRVAVGGGGGGSITEAFDRLQGRAENFCQLIRLFDQL